MHRSLRESPVMIRHRMGRALPAMVVALAVQSPVVCLAQTAPAPAEPASPSLGHAAVKGLTQKALTTTASAIIFYAGTGSLAMTGWLAGVTAVTSYGVYVANDYLWDRFSPLQPSPDGKGFDAQASVWRNTEKYLTFKPAVVATAWGIVYAFTGSWTSTVTLGGLQSLSLPVTFYLNNVGWDWYDWYTQPKTEAPLSVGLQANAAGINLDPAPQ